MIRHLRANLWLLGLTVLLCSVVYPAAIWMFAQTLFRDTAQGSLVDNRGRLTVASGEAVGSRLIAQPFTGDEYFHPRPSAVGYNAAASGASNWGANNYLLRLRVARLLGPMVRFGEKSPKKGELVGPDIELWFRLHPPHGGKGIVAQWALAYPSAAATWVKADQQNAAYVEEWRKTHQTEVADWIKSNPGTPEPKSEDLAVAFFVRYSAEHPGTFPGPVEYPESGEKMAKVIEPVDAGNDIRSNFFEMWRQENPDVDLELVPADMVMASGSGLDPHITLKNALHQVDRVAEKWAAETKQDPANVRQAIVDLLHEKAEAPLGGLVGLPLINVLEVNLALKDRVRTIGQDAN